MFSFLSSAFHYFFSKHSEIDTDDEKQDFLAEELIKLEANAPRNDNNADVLSIPPKIPRNTQCFQRTGK